MDVNLGSLHEGLPIDARATFCHAGEVLHNFFRIFLIVFFELSTLLYQYTQNINVMERTNIINYAALWERIGSYASRAGRLATRPVLLLYFVMVSKKTSWEDRMVIFSTLSYIVLPIDILNAKRLPIIGWIDEIASLSLTYRKIRKNITPEMEMKVDALLDKWFPEYASCEIMPD